MKEACHVGTFETAITRAETDLAHVQSALDTAQQVLEVADRAHTTGRRGLRLLRIVVFLLGIAGLVVTAVVLLDRLSRHSTSETEGTADINGSRAPVEPTET
jgi:hypothetical protein